MSALTTKRVVMGNKSLKLPLDFIQLPFRIYYSGGKIKHNFDFNQYKGGTPIYADGVSGNDATGNGALNTPYKTINKCLDIIEAGADSKYEIRCKSVIFVRDQTGSAKTITGKTVAIVPYNTTNTVELSVSQTGLSWIADGTGTWKTTRTNTYGVFDMRIKDSNNVPIPVTAKTSTAECQAAINSWYTDGTTVWVHTNDELIPNDTNFRICLSTTLFDITLLSDSKLYCENLLFMGGAALGVRVNGDASGATVTGECCFYNCISVAGNQRNIATSDSNSFHLLNIKKSYFFNCFAAYGARDGFNYHYTNVPEANRRECLAFEYNCTSYNHGRYSEDLSNNATTAHEGVCTLRLNCIGYSSTGPVCDDVNGCYSILYNCHMYDSSLGYSAFYFSNTGMIIPGIAILNDCIGDGNVNYGISASSGYNYTLKNFRGSVS